MEPSLASGQNHEAESPDSAAGASMSSLPPPTNPTDSPRAGGPQGSRRFRKGTIVLLLLAALVVAVYLGWRQYGELAVLHTGDRQPSEPPPVVASEAARQAEVVTRLEHEVVELSDHRQRQEQRLAELETRLADVYLQTQSQQRSIQELTATTREDWLLAEAEYLLRLANQRILTERQGRNALSLMASADAILKSLDDPELFAVRKALAADITALRLAGDIDREGIYLQLAALIGAIPQLDMPLVETEVAEAAPPAQTEPWYRTLADNAWAALKKLSGIVRVERVDEMAVTRLLPSQQELVRLNLRLLLEQAQLGLLREEQAVYRASLASARQMMAERFGGDSDAEALQAQLAELEARSVVQDLPTVTVAIKALQDYSALWHGRAPPAEAPTPAGPQGSDGEQP